MGYARNASEPGAPLDRLQFVPTLSRLGDRGRTATRHKQVYRLKDRGFAAVVFADNEIDSGERIECIRLEGTEPRHLK